MRRARELRRDATPAERLLWRGLRNGALGARVRRQVPLGPYVVDFLAAAARLVVELDGDTHASAAGLQRHARRDAWLRSHGLRVLRFTNREVFENLDGVLATLAEAVAHPHPGPLPEGEGAATPRLHPLPEGKGRGEGSRL